MNLISYTQCLIIFKVNTCIQIILDSVASSEGFDTFFQRPGILAILPFINYIYLVAGYVCNKSKTKYC